MYRTARARAIFCTAVVPSVVIALALAFSTASLGQDQGRGQGDRPPTPEEQAYLDTVTTPVHDVMPNELSRQRVRAQIATATRIGASLPASETLPSLQDTRGTSPRPCLMPPHPNVLAKIRSQGYDSITVVDLHSLAVLKEMKGIDQAGPITAPVTGTRPALVLLADYSDWTHNAASTPTLYDNMLFSVGTYPSPGSMRDFYRQASYGLFDISPGTVDSAWRITGHPHNYYANADGIAGTADDYGFGSYPQNAQGLVVDAVALADPYINFASYAVGGQVQGLFVIHTGRGAETDTSHADWIWSHKWGLNSNAVTVDGVIVNVYSMEPEYVYSAGDSTVGVYCHEYGHVLGMPDLYDTDYTSEGLGNWSLMAGGSWNGTNGNSPAHPDAWTRMQLGWVTPQVLTGALVGASIPAVEDNQVVYKLWTGGVMSTEYFLLENRQRRYFDAALPAAGLLLYHVDETASQTNDWHPRVMLEQADGLWHLQYGTNRGDGGDPYPGTANNRSASSATVPSTRSYAGTDAMVSLANISDSAQTMTADIDVGTALPPNDNCANAVVVSSVPFTGSVDARAATTEASDPTPGCGSGSRSKSVWYRFTPSCSGVVTADTFTSGYDTVLSAWTGSCGNLTQVACDDDSGGLQSQVSFAGTAGTTYYFMITAYSGSAGALVFHLSVSPPANDNCADAMTIPFTPYSSSVQMCAATTEGSDPSPSCGNGSRARSVWYRFTSSSSGTITANTFTSNYDTILSAWTGSCGSFTQLACNDDSGGLQSQISFPANVGTTYYFMVTSYSGGGTTLVFNLQQSAPAVHHFSVQVTPAPPEPQGGDLTCPLGFVTHVEARDAGDALVTAYNGTANLTASCCSVGPTSITFTNGVWEGNVTLLCDLDPDCTLTVQDAGIPASGTSVVFIVRGKGDPTDDGAVNILDVVRVVNIALGSLVPETPRFAFQFWAADPNCDNGVNILDVIAIVNKALGTGSQGSSQAMAWLSETRTAKASGPMAMASLTMSPVVTAGPTAALAAKKIAVPILIDKAKGVAGFNFDLSYDSRALTPVEVRAGALIAGKPDWLLSANLAKNPLKVLAFSNQAKALTGGSGALVEVIFAQTGKLTNNSLRLGATVASDSAGSALARSLAPGKSSQMN